MLTPNLETKSAYSLLSVPLNIFWKEREERTPSWYNNPRKNKTNKLERETAGSYTKPVRSTKGLQELIS